MKKQKQSCVLYSELLIRNWVLGSRLSRLRIFMLKTLKYYLFAHPEFRLSN
jgi:hypothetical protein